ncbi:CO dehydrogenase/acetyl-CoA synthase delta subunit [Desulfocicer vacuolatum DSM 3385]|uniref:CO dehydrogenase/acetyl-CoA synthase delta subunit n=1 Tax=Desulfocicer vacuolatum DSM 3385 TaxID=1121400 RepID=A0A1W2DTC2_9BACT|nr:mercury methylation corrinoid protein HgcA [Desulfocicer vacuolatum]SMD00724.1 CO dehydrogenase/acetyl-CoA synthase delta subunit [Desulfocicer vacuolatum DSM 3385]
MTALMSQMPEQLEELSSSTDFTLSTKSVKILSSMPDNGGSYYSNLKLQPLETHEKAGYQLCSHVEDFIFTKAGTVPKIKTQLSRDDIFSTIMVRCGIGRNNYRVAPGLYGVGEPGRTSEVLVTANFKLSFDHLRQELKGINVWILVLDTRGVNVWCAAGKGTFSTSELVHRIESTGLNLVVDHKRVIVPQLGATGVSARLVQERCGFRVVFGPIRSRDMVEFLQNRRRVTPGMRQITFTLAERFVLTPVEIRIAAKSVFIMALALVFISGIGPQIFSLEQAWNKGRTGIVMILTGVLSGTVVTPVLLPWLPFRQFAAKGIVSGSVLAATLLFFLPLTQGGIKGSMALFLFSVAISSYFAMGFTGATPFTSPSGVEKEMKRFIPIQAILMLISMVLWIYSSF